MPLRPAALQPGPQHSEPRYDSTVVHAQTLVRCVALTGAALAVLPSAAHAGGLLGEYRWQSPQTAWAPLELQADSRVTLIRDGKPTATASVHGSGPLGVVLVIKDPPSSTSPALIAYGPAGEEAMLYPTSALQVHATGDGSDAWVVLPEGRYRLYGAADGGPVDARLRLDGLAGAAELTTVGSVTGAGSAELDRRDTAPTSNVAVVGSFFELTEPGFFAFGVAARTPSTANAPPASAAMRVERCLYGPDADHGDEAFGPGCPGGEGDDLVGTPGTGTGLIPSARGTSFFRLGAPAGRWGVGGNVEVAGPPPDIHASAIWFPFGRAIQWPVDVTTPPSFAIGFVRWSYTSGVLRATLECRPAPCAGRARLRVGGHTVASSRSIRSRGSRLRFRLKVPRSVSRRRPRATLIVEGRHPSGQRRRVTRSLRIRSASA